MTNQSLTQLQQQPDRFGRRVAAVLNAGTAELPYGVTERLRAARVQAVARRKQVQVLQVAPAFASAGAALGMRENGVSLWNRLASALPLVVLLGGLILIHGVQNDWRASEVAEVDAALLTDDLPPSAYADPGFAQFLRSGRE